MTSEEQVVELLAQTLAPNLFALFGVSPEEMGFPIYETQEEVETHLARQFSPVDYWLEEGRKIGRSVVAILTAGGADISALDIDAMLARSARERADFGPDGQHLDMASILP